MVTVYESMIINESNFYRVADEMVKQDRAQTRSCHQLAKLSA